MNLKKMMMASALLMVACCMQAQTKVIAHRGFWKTPGSSQNSISSLLKADSIGCYGSEFDVWIAKDNKLVVNHDPVYKMRPMEYSKGDALTGLKLSNGENLPSLEQYLEAGKNCNTRLILELKAHSNKKRETKAVQGILAMVKKMGLENRMEYIIGELELDQTLTSRETINTKMRATLDEATDPWGIKVNRVELKNIIPPAAIQDAMEKQMKAERERREQILIAEGEKKSAILRAEGQKESLILSAEAEKQSAILRAEATKEATIRRAEGEAEAILKVQQANADGIKFLNEAAPDQAVLTLKSLEAFAKAADGKATKLIIPSEISGIAGLASSLTEIVTKNSES